MISQPSLGRFLEIFCNIEEHFSPQGSENFVSPHSLGGLEKSLFYISFVEEEKGEKIYSSTKFEQRDNYFYFTFYNYFLVYESFVNQWFTPTTHRWATELFGGLQNLFILSVLYNYKQICFN
jgi:hypothetical protein